MTDVISSPSSQPNRRIKSFVRREGRLTPGQERALTELKATYLLEASQVTAPLNFNSLFANTAPVILEIGFGNGDSLFTQALADPQHNYLGLEVHRPGIGHLLLRAEQATLKNIKVIAHDAVEVLTHAIPENSLHAIQIYFPDPWPKKRHHKRRLIQAPFVDLLVTKLAPKGYLLIATDWAPYAEHIAAVFAQRSDFFELNPNDCPAYFARQETKFENKGRTAERTIHDFFYQKN